MLMRKMLSGGRPLPTEFLEWQVKLRAWTMVHQHGSPHAGVAPLLAVANPGIGLGVTMHSIICGLLPHESQLARKTAEFRGLYENNAGQGARAIYDAGIEYLKNSPGVIGKPADNSEVDLHKIRQPAGLQARH